MEHLELEAEVENVEGEKRTLESSIPRARAAVAEVEGPGTTQNEKKMRSLNRALQKVLKNTPSVRILCPKVPKMTSQMGA